MLSELRPVNAAYRSVSLSENTDFDMPALWKTQSYERNKLSATGKRKERMARLA
jgi:hypothetical protein